MMTTREAVKQAFAFKETRPVPYFLFAMHSDIEKRLDAYYGGASWRKGPMQYLYYKHLSGVGEALDHGRWRDCFGSTFESLSTSRVVEPALPGPSLSGYEWPGTASLLNDLDVVAANLRATDAYRLIGLGRGLFERSWTMRGGIENLLVDMVDHPRFVHELMDGIVDLHLKTMDVLMDRVPMDAYVGGDDWCDQRTAIMGLQRWREFIKPRLAKIVAHCHEHGLPCIYHVCGNVLPLVDDLLEIGLDGLESLQPEATDILALKERTRGRMVLIGGMGVQSTMPFGTPGEVRAAAMQLVRDMGKDGGYVLGPAKPLGKEVPIENIAAFVEVAMHQEG